MSIAPGALLPGPRVEEGDSLGRNSLRCEAGEFRRPSATAKAERPLIPAFENLHNSNHSVRS
jgi:hypothetical protein